MTTVEHRFLGRGKKGHVGVALSRSEALMLLIPALLPIVILSVVPLFRGIYLGFTEGVASAWLSDMAPREVRGTAFGLFHGVMGVAALPASAVLGVLWQARSAELAFVVAACLAGAGALLLVLVPRRPASSFPHSAG